MATDPGLQNFKDIIAKKKAIRLPAYPWQELALKIITELNIPPHKRNSVFLVCKKNPKVCVEKCLNDTKELCKTGEMWRYFFKLAEKK